MHCVGFKSEKMHGIESATQNGQLGMEALLIS